MVHMVKDERRCWCMVSIFFLTFFSFTTNKIYSLKKEEQGK